MLPIALTGTVHGHAGSEGKLVAYFYDGQGSPIHASPGESALYANPQGLLCVANSLTVASDNEPINATLAMPLEKLPASIAATGLQVRCAVFVGDQRVGRTDLISIDPGLLTLPTGTPPNPGNAPTGDPTDGSSNPDRSPGGATGTGLISGNAGAKPRGNSRSGGVGFSR